MKRCRILRTGVVSQQVQGRSVERKKGDVIEVTDEAFNHVVGAGYAEPAEDEPPAAKPTKRAGEVTR